MTAALDAGTGAALLDDIIAHPGDDGLRLIYADWLEDAGQHERAELIRVQIEQGRLICHHPRAKAGYLCNDALCRHCTLNSRAEALLDVIAPLIELPPGMPDGVRFTWQRGLISRVRLPLAAWQAHGPALARAHPITRVEPSDRPTAECWVGNSPLRGWTRHAPLPGSGVGQLPQWLFVCLVPLAERSGGGLVGFSDDDRAYAALSRVLIAWAKQPNSR
jgi:uncharacterized protein (TIGR02996 family)